MNLRETIHNRKLFFEFAALLLVVSICSTALLFSIFMLTGQSSNKGSAINVSGSLRMQSYVVALTVADSATKDRASRESAINAAVNEFEKRLNSPGLVNGIPQSTTSPLRILYSQIYDDFYQKLRPLATQVISDPSSAPKFLAYVPSFVKTVDSFVFDIEQSLNTQMAWLRAGLIVTCVVAFLLGIAFLFYFQKVFFNPILTLSELTSKVRKGNFSVRSDYEKGNEIGKFSDNLNFMIEDLERLYGSLEEEVRKKTEDLNQRNKTLDLLFKLRSIFSSSPELPEQTINRALEEFLGYIHGKKITLLLKSSDNSAYHLSSSYPSDPQLSKNDIVSALNKVFPNPGSKLFTELNGNYLKIKIRNATTDIGYLIVELSDNRSLQEEQRVFESVSEIFATALLNARKHEEGYRVALFEERSTIARELHDSIAQSLAFSRIQLTRLSFTLNNHGTHEELLEIVNELKTGVATAYSQLREVLTAFRLKPTSSDLRQNIRSILEEFHERSGIAYKLDNSVMGFEITANKQVHLIHILREALTNVEKHSHATEVQVRIKFDSDNRINVSIADNGQGLNQNDKEKKGHFGLSIMEERAKALGAVLTFEPNSPTGLVVNFNFPVNQ